MRGKRPAESDAAIDIAQLEADLLADIASFDLNRAHREALASEQQQKAPVGLASGLVFPEIATEGVAKARRPAPAAPVAAREATVAAGGSLLAELRDRAARFQQEQQLEQVQRTAINEVIDRGLRDLFAYLHELVAQLNVVKPPVPRSYPLIEDLRLDGLVWQEGFADYRVQSQSAGALYDVVTLSYQLRAPKGFNVERSGAAVERFRTLLFDYGLQFSCKEFRNERRFVERADFDVPGQLSVNVRWRADFEQGRIVLETRNLERLGSVNYKVAPDIMGEPLFDQFGRLLLGEQNCFRELLRRTA